MQNQLNELKRKMLEFFQRVKLKINHKKSEKVSDKKKSDVTGGKILSILGGILVAIKGILNTLFILGFIGGLFGAGVALGYGVALFDKAKVPQRRTWSSRLKIFLPSQKLFMQMGVSLLLSRVTYCELLFHLRKYQTISKRLSLQLRTNIFLNIKGLCQKL